MLDFIVMQMRKANREKGYSTTIVVKINSRLLNYFYRTSSECIRNFVEVDLEFPAEFSLFQRFYPRNNLSLDQLKKLKNFQETTSYCVFAFGFRDARYCGSNWIWFSFTLYHEKTGSYSTITLSKIAKCDYRLSMIQKKKMNLSLFSTYWSYTSY